MVGPKVGREALPKTSICIDSMIRLMKNDAIASDTAAVGAQSGQSGCFSKFAPCQLPDPVIPDTSLAAVADVRKVEEGPLAILAWARQEAAPLYSLFRVLRYFCKFCELIRYAPYRTSCTV